MKDGNSPTQMELVECTEFVKDGNERFHVCQDNSKKAHLLMCGHCNKVMQIRLENDSDFDDKVKGNPFKMMKAMKLKMCDPSKVKCPFVTIFEQLERLFGTEQEDKEASYGDRDSAFRQIRPACAQ